MGATSSPAPKETEVRNTGATVFAALSIFDHIGGIQRFNQRIVDALTSGDGRPFTKVTILSLRDSAPRALPEGCVFVGCGGRRLKFVLTFAGRLLRDRPSVVFLGHVNLAILSVITCAFAAGAAAVLFVHGIEVWGDEKERPIPWFERAVVRRLIDVVISVSSFTESLMSRAYCLPAAKFRRLNNAIDMAEGAARASSAPKKVRRRLISVARLDEAYKGIGHVVIAVARLRKKFPDIEYLVVGDGRLKPELIALARALRIDGCVRFCGELTELDLAAAYRESDVFVLSSRKEGFGIVFLEAWKHGLPVVCGNADASTEVVTHGHDGLVVDPDDIDALSAAIDRMLSNDELSRRMAQAGYETARTRFSGDVFKISLTAILDDLRVNLKHNNH